MKRFQFRLENLLQYRVHLQQQARREVAALRSEISSCEERIARIEKDRSEAAREMDGEVGAGIDSKLYGHYTRYLSGLESSIDTENVRLRELVKLLSEKKKKLTQCSVDKKVLEKLKEHRREVYYKEAMKTMQNETDEMTVSRKARSAGQ